LKTFRTLYYYGLISQGLSIAKGEEKWCEANSLLTGLIYRHKNI